MRVLISVTASISWPRLSRAGSFPSKDVGAEFRSVLRQDAMPHNHLFNSPWAMLQRHDSHSRSVSPKLGNQRPDSPNTKWREKQRPVPVRGVSDQFPLPDRTEAKQDISPETSQCPAYSYNGYVWQPKYVSMASDYASNMGSPDLGTFMKRLMATEVALADVFRTASSKNKFPPKQLLQAGCSCESVFGTRSTSQSSFPAPTGATPVGRVHEGRVFTAAGQQTQGYYPKPNPSMTMNSKAFLPLLADLHFPISRLPAKMTMNYVQIHKRDPGPTLTDMMTYRVPFHRATWLCKTLVLNTKPVSVKDVPHGRDVEDKIQADWTVAWEKCLTLHFQNVGPNQVLDARYIIGLLNYQIQQGLVDPCGIVRQALRLLQPSDRGAQSFPIKSLFFLMFCSLVEPYYVAFCSADPRNLRDLVDFCVHRICYNYTAPPTGSEHTLSYRQYSSLCNMLRTCIHFHADLLLYIPQLLLKCPPPPRPPDPAKKRPAPSAGPPVGAVAPAPIADARPSPVSAPAHADWGASPKRQRTDVDSWVAVECDANCLAYPPKRKRPCHSTAAAARDAAPLPFQWFLQDVLRVRDGVRLSSLRRVRLLLRHARVSESQAPAPADQPPGPAPGRAGHCRLVQHLTARGVALPPSTTVALLDALLYHGSTAYVGGLLFLGDHAPHQLSATFHTVCGWAVRRAHISACAVLYGAELLALFPKRHLLQGLCEAHLHAHPIAFYLDAHSAPAADLQQPNGDGPTPGARV